MREGPQPVGGGSHTEYFTNMHELMELILHEVMMVQ